MGNIVTVTRAPRLNLVKWEEIKHDSFYLNRVGSLLRKRQNESEEHIENIGYQPNWPEFMHYAFESFEATCKWVSNGRKLEDLQGDSQAEWIYAYQLNVGQFATLLDGLCDNGGKLHPTGDYPNPRVVTAVISPVVGGGRWLFELGCDVPRGIEFAGMVWPLNPAIGDSITITPQP